MKIQAIAVLRWNNDTEEPIALDSAYNLAEYNFFMRGRCDGGLRMWCARVAHAVPAPLGGIVPALLARHSAQQQLPPACDASVCPRPPSSQSPRPGTCATAGRRRGGAF